MSSPSHRALASPSPAPLPGVDVSEFQSEIDWENVAKAGVRFAYIRATHGRKTDRQFEANWRGSAAAGVPRGGYHFLVPEDGARAQAEVFLDALKKAPEGGEWLAPALDVEWDQGFQPDELGKEIREWVRLVERALGCKPVIYTSPDFWREHVKAAELASHPLWIAEWDVDSPRVPPPWTGWTIWQHGTKRTVRGISRPVDLDELRGEKELAALRCAFSSGAGGA